jgi:hypothetical protein
MEVMAVTPALQPLHEWLVTQSQALAHTPLEPMLDIILGVTSSGAAGTSSNSKQARLRLDNSAVASLSPAELAQLKQSSDSKETPAEFSGQPSNVSHLEDAPAAVYASGMPSHSTITNAPARVASGGAAPTSSRTLFARSRGGPLDRTRGQRPTWSCLRQFRRRERCKRRNDTSSGSHASISTCCRRNLHQRSRRPRRPAAPIHQRARRPAGARHPAHAAAGPKPAPARARAPQHATLQHRTKPPRIHPHAPGRHSYSAERPKISTSAIVFLTRLR